MDVRSINTKTLPPDALQVVAPSSKSKIVGDIEKSKLIQIQSGDDKQKNKFTVGEMAELPNKTDLHMDHRQTNLGFSIYEELNNQVVAEIRDEKTDEIVRQFPSEELLKIREAMVEQTGSIIDLRI